MMKMGNRVLAALGIKKPAVLQRKASSTSSAMLSHAYSSGILPALGSRASISSRNVVLNKRVIHPHNKHYR
jgi:hypothetical protein